MCVLKRTEMSFCLIWQLNWPPAIHMTLMHNLSSPKYLLFFPRSPSPIRFLNTWLLSLGFISSREPALPGSLIQMTSFLLVQDGESLVSSAHQIPVILSQPLACFQQVYPYQWRLTFVLLYWKSMRSWQFCCSENPPLGLMSSFVPSGSNWTWHFH